MFAMISAVSVVLSAGRRRARGAGRRSSRWRTGSERSRSGTYTVLVRLRGGERGPGLRRILLRASARYCSTAAMRRRSTVTTTRRRARGEGAVGARPARPSEAARGRLRRDGAAVLAGRPVGTVPLRARRAARDRGPDRACPGGRHIHRERVAQSGAHDRDRTDRNIADLMTMQSVLGAAGVAPPCWSLGVVAATRRRTSHFRSLVRSSTDSCWCSAGAGAATPAVVRHGRGRTGSRTCSARDSAGSSTPTTARSSRRCKRPGKPRRVVFRMTTRFGEWRHLEAHVTDLRGDRHVRGVVLNARDITERIELEGSSPSRPSATSSAGG